MLFCSPESIIFTDSESIDSCVELLETSAGTALQSGYDAWPYIDIHDKEKEEVTKEMILGDSSAAEVNDAN